MPARILAVPLGRGRPRGGRVARRPADDTRSPGGGARDRGPVALILAVGVTWLLVGWTLRPVESMRAEAAAISAGDPGRRLPVPGTGDELARLAETLNAMLGRLEEAIERERRFVDDASHELRTPLSNLKAELDLALRRSRTPDELEPALRSASEEADRLARLADDLLVLARSDRGRLPIRREPVDVAEMVGTVDSFAARASERGVGIDVHVSGELRAEVDELRIRQALGNLLDNGLRYVPAGGRVSVAAERDDGSLRLEAGQRSGLPGRVPPRRVRGVRAPGRVEVSAGGRHRSRPRDRGRGRAGARRDGRGRESSGRRRRGGRVDPDVKALSSVSSRCSHRSRGTLGACRERSDPMNAQQRARTTIVLAGFALVAGACGDRSCPRTRRRRRRSPSPRAPLRPPPLGPEPVGRGGCQSRADRGASRIGRPAAPRTSSR